ncbi:MAG: murein L,D-transpeptidase catalytic domain family protein [Chitinophagaceae bacterium]|jgi:hypothetical protein|nr:murein L,D-transpeptidase catalytic domain family protein [Chitinophagaceae bacterium]
MRKTNLLLATICSIITIAFIYFFQQQTTNRQSNIAQPNTSKKSNNHKKIKQKLAEAKKYVVANKLSNAYCILIDMALPSNKKRMYVYALKNDSLITKGLVAHGSCNTSFLKDAQFSNTPDCGCSALGKYKIGYKYNGQFGEAFKLYGLDSSNSNAFKRFIVLHSYSCVPNEERNFPICNSLGCPMVSPNFLDELKVYLSKTNQPILLWMFQ